MMPQEFMNQIPHHMIERNLCLLRAMDAGGWNCQAEIHRAARDHPAAVAARIPDCDQSHPLRGLEGSQQVFGIAAGRNAQQHVSGVAERDDCREKMSAKLTSLATAVIVAASF